MFAVETIKLSKHFGTKIAVDGLSLRVPKGSVFGFLGPNGAGKTTTLRMLVGLARPTSGDAFVLGESVLAPGKQYLRRIGFLPDVPGFYNWMRPTEFLMLAGDIFGMSGRDLRMRVGEVLEITGLDGVKTRIGGFSRGMKQRLGLAQALLNQPEVIFLDEPTSALDPIGRKEILDTISRLSGRTTVFFSTHILNDVERVCDTVAIINQGRLLTQQSISSLRKSYSSHKIYLEFEGEPDILAKMAGQPWIDRIEKSNKGWFLHPTDLQTAQQALPRMIVEHGLVLRRFELVEPSLEDIFVRLVNNQ
ncbi:MAG TPA: ABC transporter ATP-binding protein [Syntrophomonadaceae bacterium]|nr:ABC transporter ATP-binding protein [Syntrophomonadaceae bacterium]